MISKLVSRVARLSTPSVRFFARQAHYQISGRFEGKTVLMTGGAGDIGRATTKILLDEGGCVISADLLPEDKAKAQIAKDIGQKYADQIKYVEVDVTNTESVQALVASSKKLSSNGHIHGFFNNAGVLGQFAPTPDITDVQFREVMMVNTWGAFLCLREVSKAMRDDKTPNASIVNTSSWSGQNGPPNMLAYAASKAAVTTMTMTAAKDLAPYGIRVNTISPQKIGDCGIWHNQCDMQAALGTKYFPKDPEVVRKNFTTSIPMGRTGTLEEVAKAVVFLLSDDASYVSAQNISLTGGNP